MARQPSRLRDYWKTLRDFKEAWRSIRFVGRHEGMERRLLSILPKGSSDPNLIERERAKLLPEQLLLLDMLAMGLIYKEIGEIIGISDDAGSASVRRIYKRLDVKARAKSRKAFLVLGRRIWVDFEQRAELPRTWM